MFLALLACGATDERSADVWTPSVRVDADGDGYSPDAGDRADCDDADPDNHPTAVEVCDGEDDDCDGEIDEGLTNIYYPDADHDGYGDPTLPLAACAPPEDHTANADDCDDLNADVHPDRQEVCNTADDDCDGRVDEDPTDGSEWYDDVDGDGHGAGYTRVLLCYVPDDRVPLDDDCDDSDAAVHPGASEICNGVDDDCDGSRPTDEVDNDRDSQLACDGDCDDADATIWFGGVEDCDDGIDNDCDGTTDVDCNGCDYIILSNSSSIQDAIDLAVDGDVICVGADIFRETLDFSGKNIVVLGVGSDLSTLDGRGMDRVVNFIGGESADAVLQGFTIQNGSVERDDAGGILIVGSSPTLQDLVVTYNQNSGYPSLRGGGIFVDAGAPTLIDVVLRDNFAVSREAQAGLGGGIALEDSDAILDGVVIDGNSAGSAGCGLWLEDSSVAVFATVIRDNDGCDQGGAGLWATRGTPTFENVWITGNGPAYDGTGWGGGVWLEDSDAAFTNVVITGNDGEYGGGVYVDGGAPVFTNVVITGNTATAAGGGVYVEGGTPSFRYSDLYDNLPDDTSGFTDPTGTDGNVSVDPVFFDAVLHLDATSPLIDAGDPALLDPDGSVSDIGWFGGAGADAIDIDGDGWASWWLPGPYDASTSPGFDCADNDATIYPGSGC